MPFVGIVLMVVAQRWDYRRLRALAPMLILVSLALLAAVLVIGPAINGARRWISFGPAVFQPSEVAKLALAIWAAALPRAEARAARPARAVASGRSARGGLLPAADARARHGHRDRADGDADGDARRRGTPARVLGAALTIACALGTVAIWLEPYRRARFFAFLHPVARRAGHRLPARAGDDLDGLGRLLRRRPRPERREDLLPARGAHGHDARGDRRGARPRRRRRGDRRLRALHVRGPEHRDALQGSVRQAARGRADGARLRARRRSTSPP